MLQFKETVEFLVTLHEGEIAALNHENKKLQSELEDLRKRLDQGEPLTWEVRAKDDRGQGFLPPIMQPPTPDETNSKKEFAEPEEQRISRRTMTSEPTRSTSLASISLKSVQSTLTWRARFRQFIATPFFEGLICILVVCNALIMAVELQHAGLDAGYDLGWHDIDRPVQETWPHAPIIFTILERTFTVIFTIEVSVKLALLGLAYFQRWDSYVDTAVVAVALFALITEQTEAVNASALRLLRLVKLARFCRIVKITKVLDSLQLLLQAMQASVSTLFWSLLVLMVVQCMVGMMMSQLLQPWFRNESIEQARRQRVYRYYGTFTYAIITMFEVHLANWSPACRVLIDDVSQWYGLALVVYRCLAGFAVLNVINAVFIQRTMKVAQNNAEYMMAQKMKEVEKLKAVFKTMDTSGDGKLSRQEVDDMLLHTETRALFACLDMDANDLEVLFELFDDGDGLITADEFLMGTARLKGDAKNIDMARLMSQVGRVEAQVQDVNQIACHLKAASRGARVNLDIVTDYI